MVEEKKHQEMREEIKKQTREYMKENRAIKKMTKDRDLEDHLDREYNIMKKVIDDGEWNEISFIGIKNVWKSVHENALAAINSDGGKKK